MKLLKRIFIQRFTIFDLFVIFGIMWLIHHLVHSTNEILLFHWLSVLFLVVIGLGVSICGQLALGTKMFNGWTISEIIDEPRY